MKYSIDIKAIYYFGIIFILSAGMFDYYFNNIFTYLTLLYLAPIIYVFIYKKSIFLIITFLVFSIVLIIILLNIDLLKYGFELNVARSFQGETIRSNSVALDQTHKIFDIVNGPLVTTLKAIIKVFLLFLIFPIEDKYLEKITKYSSKFIYFVFFSILITSVLINLLGVDASQVRYFYPLTSNINPELEIYPFFFIEPFLPILSGIEYVRPYSIFHEPTGLGNFIIHLFLINFIVTKKFDTNLFFISFSILILSIAKFAAVVFFIFYITYLIAKYLH